MLSKRGETMAGFADVLGHEQTIAHMKKAIELGKVSHAYIINGEKGSGRSFWRAFSPRPFSVRKKGRNLVCSASPAIRQSV